MRVAKELEILLPRHREAPAVGGAGTKVDLIRVDTAEGILRVVAGDQFKYFVGVGAIALKIGTQSKMRLL